jgi:acyl transferase domain-containing protein
VSSFGLSGTNAHLVLEKLPYSQPAHSHDEITPGGPYFLPISAHSPEALQSMAKAYKAFLTVDHNDPPSPDDDEINQKFCGGPGGGFSKEPPGFSLHDICYTSSMRRQHHDYRLALVGDSREKLSQHLDAFFQGETRLPGLSSGRKPLKRQQKLAFVFSGQGSQWPGMGRELLDREPVFRDILQQCDREIQRQANWSLLEELAADEAHSRLADIDVLQPVLFSIQVALAALWQSRGIEPDAVVGYSLGEIAAAYVSGALNLEDAVRIICSRSRLLTQIKGQGSLAVVELSLEKTQQALTGWDNRVSIAASSSPTITVLSGEPEALQEFLASLENQGIFCVPREEDVAVHTHQLDPLCAELVQALEGLEGKGACIPFYSTVTGKASKDLVFDAAYWVRNLREPVLFSAAVQQMLADGYEIFLELSPHPILSSSVQEWMQVLHKKGAVLPSLRRKKNEGEVILDSLGALYTLGLEVNWDSLYAQKGRCLWLPSYTWQRERYWIETGKPHRSGEELISTPEELAGDWLFEVEWKPKARAAPDQGEPDRQGSWLIFCDGSGLGVSLAERLNKRGETCVLVFPGEAYEISTAGTYRINPGQPEDFHRLIGEIPGDEQLSCNGIVHLWSLDTAPPGETTAASLKADQALNCGSVLHLCQALAAASWSTWPRLWLVTKGGQPVNSQTEPVVLARAPLWGLGIVIGMEHPQLGCVRVDMDPSGESEINQALFEEIWTRNQDQDQEDQVAFRRGVRYVPRLVSHNWKSHKSASAFQPDGTYLITGGLGGIGLTVAKWMVDRGARHLVLVGRSEASAAAQDVLNAMRKHNAKIVVARADVTREDQVAGVLAEISQSMPPLKGIIHAAGVFDRVMLVQQQWEPFAKVLAPKVEGAWNLHALTRDIPLDFFVFFSSAASIGYSPGLFCFLLFRGLNPGGQQPGRLCSGQRLPGCAGALPAGPGAASVVHQLGTLDRRGHGVGRGQPLPGANDSNGRGFYYPGTGVTDAGTGTLAELYPGDGTAQ